MTEEMSPKYQMKLIEEINEKLYDLFSSSKYKNVELYIKKWHTIETNIHSLLDEENFPIILGSYDNIDLIATLNNIDQETLIKIAIDLGVDTPDFIPSIPTFRNTIKADYETASSIFEKAYKQIEEHPDIAIGLVNSALESIIKEILKDNRIKTKLNSKKTLYDLTTDLLKEFQLFPKSDMPKEIKTIGSSLLSINQSIEKLRSEKTNMHGKTLDDYIIKDSIYTYFVVNSVVTIGQFIISFYNNKFPKESDNNKERTDIEDLPFEICKKIKT